ncbi:MAG: hypothetical protein KGO81_04260 [Bacteroidota bacterium]|nr:hypothetical protein [Bacteroidota bacterium]
MKTYSRIYFLFPVIFSFVPNILYAIPPHFSDDIMDVNAPLDGGLSFLLSLGVGYGARKLRYRKKKD